MYIHKILIQDFIPQTSLPFIKILPTTMKTSFLTIADGFPLNTLTKRNFFMCVLKSMLYFFGWMIGRNLDLTLKYLQYRRKCCILILTYLPLIHFLQQHVFTTLSTKNVYNWMIIQLSEHNFWPHKRLTKGVIMKNLF